VDREGAGLDASIVVGVSYSSVDVAGAGDTVAFRLASAFVDGCAARAPFGPRVVLMPCARLEGGYHFAEVVPGAFGTAGHPWFAGGLVAWLRVPIAAGFFGSLAIGAEVPFTPADFKEQGAKSSLFTSPPVTGSINLGGGVSFP
jgi:hypothetical protein